MHPDFVYVKAKDPSTGRVYVVAEARLHELPGAVPKESKKKDKSQPKKGGFEVQLLPCCAILPSTYCAWMCCSSALLPLKSAGFGCHKPPPPPRMLPHMQIDALQICFISMSERLKLLHLRPATVLQLEPAANVAMLKRDCQVIPIELLVSAPTQMATSCSPLQLKGYRQPGSSQAYWACVLLQEHAINCLNWPEWAKCNLLCPEMCLCDSMQVLKKMKGSELVGKTYKPMFPYFSNLKAAPGSDKGAFRVVSDGYVTADAGTGVVHQAPFFGEDDYRVCRKFGEHFTLCT